ncbi:unnamed protein product [Polarella glacialis]|uniref:Uncharacterized protein n=1 Tax=Polarella glacialis TaxID=89957 RepID=A0A813DJ07_POLGL|nr:unnamed protein product [Polarella glacialis]
MQPSAGHAATPWLCRCQIGATPRGNVAHLAARLPDVAEQQPCTLALAASAVVAAVPLRRRQRLHFSRLALSKRTSRCAASDSGGLELQLQRAEGDVEDAPVKWEDQFQKVVEPGLGKALRLPLPCTVVCGIGPPPGEGGASSSVDESTCQRLFRRLREEAALPIEKPVWVDLTTASQQPFEELDLLMARCRAAVICPDFEEGDRRRLRAVRVGLKFAMSSFPVPLSRVVLLSQIGAQDGKGGFNLTSFFGAKTKEGTVAGFEDDLTSAARRRPGNRPLRVTIVRVGMEPEGWGLLNGPEVSATTVRCLSGNADGNCQTSRNTAACALLEALAFSVDSGFTVVEEPLSAGVTTYRLPCWEELLLPFVGPEIWRIEVADAQKAAIFVQQWAETFFGADRGPAMRFGLKTAVEQRRTPSGCIFKFRPVDTPSGRLFEDLEYGGLEFMAETPVSGPPRLRARRSSYGFKVVTKENSERALLRQFEQDWNQAMQGGSSWISWPSF